MILTSLILCIFDEKRSELDNDITMAELLKALAKHTNNEAPGLNGVPPNAFKTMNE